jgi:hypothetical protein
VAKGNWDSRFGGSDRVPDAVETGDMCNSNLFRRAVVRGTARSGLVEATSHLVPGGPTSAAFALYIQLACLQVRHHSDRISRLPRGRKIPVGAFTGSQMGFLNQWRKFLVALRVSFRLFSAGG